MHPRKTVSIPVASLTRKAKGQYPLAVLKNSPPYFSPMQSIERLYGGRRAAANLDKEFENGWEAQKEVMV